MRLINKLLFAFAACILSVSAMAAPLEGFNYLRVAQPQNTDAGNKVEVIEFFAYSCPHCNSFEPLLAAWVKKNADKVVFKRVHMANNIHDAALQRVFATMEAMGITEKYHAKLFFTLHVDHIRVNTDETAFEWAGRVGIDQRKFIDTYRSFGVQSRVNRMQTAIGAYNVEQWPMIAVDGRYLVAPYLAGLGAKPPMSETAQQQAALAIMDQLVAQAAKAKAK